MAQARTWAGAGLSQQAIAERLGVAQSVISELLARRGPLPAQLELPEPEPAQPAAPNAEDAQASTAEPATAEPAGTKPGATEPGATEPGATEPVDGEPRAAFTGTSRVSTGRFLCRYAGAMLLHAYLDRVDAQAIFATLAGGPARRYDDLAVLSTATLGLRAGDRHRGGGQAPAPRRGRRRPRAHRDPAAGHLPGPAVRPRGRLGPTRGAARVRREDAGRRPRRRPSILVDDHFVPYAGARPVGKGWNTKRRHAQPGRDDTLLVDARGRAVVFGSGEPDRAVHEPARRAGRSSGP